MDTHKEACTVGPVDTLVVTLSAVEAKPTFSRFSSRLRFPSDLAPVVICRMTINTTAAERHSIAMLDDKPDHHYRGGTSGARATRANAIASGTQPTNTGG
jgi:hypothetical protein